MPVVRAGQIALRPGDRITSAAVRSIMAQHEMQVEIDRYEKQYGYAHNARLVCSCGYESPWEAGRGEGLTEDHRRQVIEDALGLTFVTKRPAHVTR